MDIKAGDLVMVVRPAPCCGATDLIGLAHAVLNVMRPMGGDVFECNACGNESTSAHAELLADRWIAVQQLIRIDPLPEPETVVEEAVA